MCDDEECSAPDPRLLGLHAGEVRASRALVTAHGSAVTRRDLLRVGSGAAALAFLASRHAPVAAAAGRPTAAGLVLPDGRRSSRHAMHVHSSPSEGRASFANQAALAEQSGCDYLWTTEHDWRLWAVPGDDRITRTYPFTSLESDGWRWKPVTAGSASGRRADIVPYGGGSALALEVASAGSATCGLRATTDTHRFEGSVIGRQVLAPATLTALSGEAYFEIVLMFSNQGSTPLHLVYRYGPRPASRRRVGATTGHVHVPLAVGSTVSTPLSPVDDLRHFFGDTCLPEDNSIVALQLQVTAVDGSIAVRLPRLDLPRTVTGQAAFDAVVAVYDTVLASHPSVTRRRGIEVSGDPDAHHLGWYGDDATNLPFTGDDSALVDAVARIRRDGSVASYNHPFGTTPVSRDVARILEEYAIVVPTRVHGADVIELGYDERAGMTTADHLALGDLLWCDGVVLTANGVSDDHNGNSWRESFLTQLWGHGGPASELDALRSGRATVTRVGWGGDLWLSLDGRPMGSVPTTRQPGNAELAITVTDLPSTASIQVVSGRIAKQGTGRTGPDTTVTTIPASRVKGGVARLTAKGGNAFHRAMVVDEDGSVRQFTNPVWSGVPDSSIVPPSRFVAV